MYAKNTHSDNKKSGAFKRCVATLKFKSSDPLKKQTQKMESRNKNGDLKSKTVVNR